MERDTFIQKKTRKMTDFPLLSSLLSPASDEGKEGKVVSSLIDLL